MKECVGKGRQSRFPVKITWRRPEDDWNDFFILYECDEGYLLQGRDDDAGNKHDGDIFFAYRKEISSIER